MTRRRIGVWNSQMRFPPVEDCIFIDIETDLDANRVWLIGMKYRGKVTQLVAKNFTQERQILLDFGKYLEDKPGKPLVCYSTTNFDFRVIWSRILRLRLYSVQISMKNRALIDLGTLLRRHFIPFGRKYSLKFIRYLIGYEYENPSMRGDEIAIRYYTQVRKLGTISSDFEKLAKSYNRDDVEILEFMLEQFTDNIRIENRYLHNLEASDLIDDVKPKIYSYRNDESAVRISVPHEYADEVQAVLMRLGCPLPEKREGVHITALYWRSTFAHRLMSKAIQDNQLDLDPVQSNENV